MFVYHFNITSLLIDDRNRWALLFVIIAAFPILFLIPLPVAEKSYAIDHQQFAAIFLGWFEFNAGCTLLIVFIIQFGKHNKEEREKKEEILLIKCYIKIWSKIQFVTNEWNFRTDLLGFLVHFQCEECFFFSFGFI